MDELNEKLQISPFAARGFTIANDLFGILQGY